MKVIAVGDPHFHTDNIPDVNLFIDRLEQLVKEEQPDLVVILGDLLHTHERLHTTPLNKAYEFVLRMRNLAKTYVLVGNHDMCNNQQFLTSNHWMNGMKEWENVYIVDTILHDDIKGYHLVFCPYVPPGRFEEALNNSDRDWSDAACIFAHQEFYGCKMGAIVSVEGDRWPDDYPYVLSGHIHSKQTIQKNVYYCGSSMQHAFGESDKNIIPILTFRDHTYDLREIDLKLPRKKIIYTDIQGMEDYTPPETDDKIKITISGVYDEFKAFKKTKKYRELTKNGTKVVFKPKVLKSESDHETKEPEQKDLQAVNETDFDNILFSLIQKEHNSYLDEVFNLVIKNKIPEE